MADSSVTPANRPRMRWVIGFDLDDTLISEKDYAFSGFHAAGVVFQKMTGCPDLAATCRQQWQAGVRENLFDRSVEMLGIPAERDLITSLVTAYRNHCPGLVSFPDVIPLLLALRASPSVSGVALLSDGWLHGQQAKLAAAGLREFFDLIVFTDQWGRAFWKPHPRGYLAIESLSGVEKSHFMYVADNPHKDFDTPATRGWVTVRIQRPDGIYTTAPSRAPGIPTHTVADFGELSDLFKTCCAVSGLP